MAQRTDPNTRTGSTGRLVLSAGCAPQCVESTTCAVIASWPSRADRVWPRRGSYPCEQHVRNRRASPCGPDRMSSHREAHVRVDGRGGRERRSIADTGVGVGLLRSWSQDPICWHQLVSQARGIQRTRRQASLIRKVQAAMSRVDESRQRDAHTTGDHPGRDGNHDRATGGRHAPELRSAIPPRRRVT
jgi:hypothetical protein